LATGTEQSDDHEPPQMVEEYNAAEHGEKGASLRREGL
jgi:hypothetical protein